MTFVDQGQGSPLVLVHGFPLDLTLWDGQAALSEQHRLIRLDLPGFGGTPAPTGSPSMASYSEAVLAALDRAGLARAAFCGLSMGGYILFELWRRHPERVSALILCDTRAEADSAEGRIARRQGIERLRQGGRQEFLEEFWPKLLAPASLANPKIMSQLGAMGERASDAGLVAALQAMHDRPDSFPTLATIRVPTLVVVGAEDRLTPPACARAIQAGIAGSRLAEIPGAGHLTALEQPLALNAAIKEFLVGTQAP